MRAPWLVGLAGALLAAGLTEPLQAAPSRQLIDQHCVSCHNDRLKTAGLSLERLSLDNVGADANIWEKVVQKLGSGQMPPVGQRRPDKTLSATFLRSLEDALDQAAAAKPNPGRPAAHRLNRTEYGNAVRDLLGLDVDARSLLPADDTDQHGFDTNADVLSMSPALFERYLSAARTVTRLALGRPATTPSIDTYTVPKLLVQDERASERLPFGTRGGAAITHYFPADGDYEITIALQKTLYSAVRGLAEPHELELRIDRSRVKSFTVGGEAVVPPPASFAGTLSWNPEWERYASQADRGLEVRVPAKAGSHTVGVSFVRQRWQPDDVLQPRRTGWAFETDEMFDGSPAVETITIRGPLSVSGPGETASRARILTCRPTRPNEEERCASNILSTLARRAYRRTPSAADVETLVGFYRAGRREGDFEAGIERALQRILVSPDFLFRIELDPSGAPPGAPHRISDVELASRLSFFLWSSLPDDELLEIASKGDLKKPAVLERQVRRLLADSRAKALVENFAASWLQLRDLRHVIPDPDLFPDFDENLRKAFEEETTLFIESQIRDDKSAVELLTADYTFVNERLARHYGMAGVYGPRFRRVAIDPSRRGGLLGHASLLTITSYPNRTSPVLRGKWLLENVLGAPPPPPPPDVPALSDRGVDGRRQSVRERLQQHRSNPACAACHAQMDPLGFALDHFDAVGGWRTSGEGNAPVDASGALPDGETFSGLNGLRTLLVARKERFVGTIAERLLAYALGRGIEYYDRPALRAITRGAARDDYRWSALILGVIESAPFRMRRTES